MAELLATTPYSSAVREVCTLSGTLAWIGITYALVAALLTGITSLNATWGAPDMAVVAVGLVAVGASGALGYATGLYVHSRFTAPLLAVVLFVGQFAVAIYAGPLHYLSPVGTNAPSVFYTVQANAALPQLLWFLGLMATALVAVVLKGSRSLLARGAMLAFLSVAAVGAEMVTRAGAASWELERHLDRRMAEIVTGGPFQASPIPEPVAPPAPYEPVCLERALPICVHPAYQAMLSETANLVERLVAPLASLPGGPRRAVQKEVDVRRTFLPGGTFTFSLYSAARTGNMWMAARDVAMSLVVDEAVMAERAVAKGESTWSMTDAQRVVADWLLIQAGVPLRDHVSLDERVSLDLEWALRVRLAVPGWSSSLVEREALKRFAALDAAVRRAWLENNYVALRAGKLTLEDLP